MSKVTERHEGGCFFFFIRDYSSWAGLMKTGGACEGDHVGTGGARKLRRCLKLGEDQERQTEAASEASFHQAKVEKADGGGTRRRADGQTRAGRARMSPRTEDGSTVRGTCSRLETLLPPP